MDSVFEVEEVDSDEVSTPNRYYALAVFTLINMFNYIDRFVPSATKILIKRDLGLSDAQTSVPLTAFLVVYMVAAPVFGTLSDHGVSRRLLLFIGILVWSVSTAASALAVDFWTFLLARAAVGFGESAYATIAPAMLSEYFFPAEQPRMFGVFYAAVPVGAALGYIIGGVVGQTFGWRWAFVVCGLPGLGLCALVWTLPTPVQQKKDTAPVPEIPTWSHTICLLAHNKRFVITVVGQTLLTFALGGVADWIPTYLVREHDISIAAAGLTVGLVTVCMGVGGTLIGPVVVSLMRNKYKNSNLAVSSLSMAPAALFALFFLITTSVAWAVVLFAVADFFVWFFSGPTNTEIATTVLSSIRTRSFAVSIFLMHALGDAISPTIIGAISDKESLKAALFIFPIMLCLAGITWGIGWQCLIPAEEHEHDYGLML